MNICHYFIDTLSKVSEKTETRRNHTDAVGGFRNYRGLQWRFV